MDQIGRYSEQPDDNDTINMIKDYISEIL